VASLALSFGSGAMTNSIGDAKDSDVIMVIGSNADTSHPTIGLRIHQAKQNGTKLLVVDPRRTGFADEADLWLRPNPGSDVALLNGMVHVILEEGLWDKKFVEDRTENFEELEIVTAKYTPAYVEQITGIAEDQLRAAARLYASPGKRCAIYYGMGLAHHATGTDNVKSIANLAMLCGKLGMAGGGVNPLRGQNNVQGACDMGALFNTLPGYSGLDNNDAFDRYEKMWEVKLPRRKGKAATEVWDAILEGDIRGIYVFGEDPVLADPNALHAIKALEKLDFLIVQDIFLTDTAKMADIVFPAACYAEKDGTFTCTERRVQRVRKAVEPPGEAKADWQIFCELSHRMGYEMPYANPEEIFNEVTQLLPQYAGITYDRIEKVGLQWPVPSLDHPGTPVLHIGKFTQGKGLFIPEDYTSPTEMPDADYPLILTTIRETPQYNFGSMTRKTPEIEALCPEPFAEINPEDAARLGIADLDKVEISSRRGTVRLRAKITDRSQVGTIAIPYHFAEVPVNNLTLNSLDRLSRSPQYKICAIKASKVEA
jgi:formate dehydrogenase alpha subunit